MITFRATVIYKCVSFVKVQNTNFNREESVDVGNDQNSI